MKCSEVKNILKNDSDPEIAANKGLISHIRECCECSKKYGVILNLSMATAMKEEMRLPADFEGKVWKKIGGPNPAFSFLRNIMQPKWAIAAAAVIMLFLIAVPLMNKGAMKNNIKDIAVKPADKTVIKVTQKANPGATDALKGSKPQPGNAVAENIVEKQAPQKQETVAVPKQIQQGNPGFTAHYSASAPSYKTASGAASGSKISAAGVQKELTASYNKGEDDLKGDVAVSGNVFHPLQGEAVTIKYRIKKAAKVIMAVYDRKGKVVKMIYNGEQGQGVFTESWNGKDNNGIIAGSGIYIIYLKTDSGENKIKVGVIK
jgi:hypothetical protein